MKRANGRVSKIKRIFQILFGKRTPKPKEVEHSYSKLDTELLLNAAIMC